MHKPSDLNDAQWQAVTHKGGHLLIVAGPGTGKTHTLIHRIARTVPLLNAGEYILALTFTNKAALQMKDRLMALDVPQTHVCGGTFHAFCLQLLRDYWERAALPKEFKVAAPDDIEGFDKRSLERIGLIKSTHLVIEPDEEFKAYSKYLRQKNMIDFDDILREALLLLEEEDIAESVRKKYPHIFIDEYQDINIVQNALLKVLAGKSGQVTAIGDPNQSIYGFRGCDVQLFHRFGADFPGSTTLYLNENYRSSVNLLAVSAQVIRRQDDHFELMARMYVDGKLVIHGAETDRAEADYVARQIEKIVGGLDMLTAGSSKRSFGDIAILYRLNAERLVLTQALDHLSIPYQVSTKPAKAEEYSDEAVLGQYEEVLDYHVERVSLLTLHAAKGLEFPVVFMVGCEDKILPLDIEDMKADAEEERRLFFVGMTRAKECLYLTHAARRQLFGKTVFHVPSPFLSDIEEELKDYEAARQRKKVKKNEVVDNGQMKLF